MKHRGGWHSTEFEFICDANCPLCEQIRSEGKAQGAIEEFTRLATSRLDWLCLDNGEEESAHIQAMIVAAKLQERKEILEEIQKAIAAFDFDKLRNVEAWAACTQLYKVIKGRY
jgi:hypothetical protein